MRLRSLSFEQQTPFDIVYKKVKVGRFTPDLVVLGRIIVDTKVIDRITDHERGQMPNYLRITHLPVGVILKRRHPLLLRWQETGVAHRRKVEVELEVQKQALVYHSRDSVTKT